MSKNDEVASTWKMKVGPSTRGWKAPVEEQVPDERIVWSSEGAKGTTHGCVNFHELTPDLTRIVLVVEHYPSGFFEKTGNLWRAQGWRSRLDFKNFQRYVTFADEEVEGWRGEIRDGEVVRSHEEHWKRRKRQGRTRTRRSTTKKTTGTSADAEGQLIGRVNRIEPRGAGDPDGGSLPLPHAATGAGRDHDGRHDAPADREAWLRLTGLTAATWLKAIRPDHM